MRVSVPLPDAARLVNHGPTTLLASQHGGRTNVMAAAWVMALDFDPPKLVAVVSSDTFTRQLMESSGELVVSLPTAALADLTLSVGRSSGHDLDKLAAFGIRTAPARKVKAPLIEGCAAWLECKIVDEPHNQKSYDLFVLEVVAAWADDRVYRGREWRFDAHPELRTLHHMAGGVFFATGERIVGKKLTPKRPAPKSPAARSRSATEKSPPRPRPRRR